jgi:hypothetical protein
MWSALVRVASVAVGIDRYSVGYSAPGSRRDLPLACKYVQVVAQCRLPGTSQLDHSLSVALIPMLLWSTLVVSVRSLTTWMRTVSATQLALKRCSSARMQLLGQDGRSVPGLLYSAAVRLSAGNLTVILVVGETVRQRPSESMLERSDRHSIGHVPRSGSRDRTPRIKG